VQFWDATQAQAEVLGTDRGESPKIPGAQPGCTSELKLLQRQTISQHQRWAREAGRDKMLAAHSRMLTHCVSDASLKPQLIWSSGLCTFLPV
jgi:hypothetical protein